LKKQYLIFMFAQSTQSCNEGSSKGYEKTARGYGEKIASVGDGRKKKDDRDYLDASTLLRMHMWTQGGT
jgi:hypothetical protein